MTIPDIRKATIARLTRKEDGALSNAKVERYALLRSEECCSPNAAWITCMSGGDRKRAPGGGYQSNVHKSPVFKARLEELMSEKAELEEAGVWGRLEWQARQLYRFAAAMGDLNRMSTATEQLYKIAVRNQKISRDPTEADPDAPETKRGRGAPTAPTPQPEDTAPDYFAERLVSR